MELCLLPGEEHDIARAEELLRDLSQRVLGGTSWAERPKYTSALDDAGVRVASFGFTRGYAWLALEDGTSFEGLGCGADGVTSGEVVFNTSMTGYQEILTDPSYAGQIVTMTYVHIGNYGVNEEDVESRQPFVRGFVMRECCMVPSNHRATMSLPDYLKKNNIVAIDGVDTRKITKILRTIQANEEIAVADALCDWIEVRIGGKDYVAYLTDK